MTEPSSAPKSAGIAPQIAIVAVVGLLALVGGLYVGDAFKKGNPSPPVLEGATVLGDAARALPAFSLSDHTGANFDAARFRGRWSVVFFGYTHCPDICPITLSTMRSVMGRLESDTPEPTVIFVSVDPQRDSLAKLGEYVTFFDPGFVGVTGDEEEIAKLARGLGAVYVKVEGKTEADYLVDHSASMLVVNPDAELYAVLSAPHTPEGVAKNLNAILAHGG